MGRLAFSGGQRRNSHFLNGSPVQAMLWFLLLAAHSAHQVLSSDRNLTYVEETVSSDISTTGLPPVPIWNEFPEKSKKNCLSFHDDRFSELFFYWPEVNPLFKHCCFDPRKIYDDETGGHTIPDNLTFRYSQYGEHLQYAWYRDVGYFDQCLPFWKCRKAYQAIFDTKMFLAFCKRTDMARFYTDRFWRLIIWKYSFLQTVLPWIPFLEVTVASLALILFPLTWRLPTGKASGWKYLVPTANIWFKSIWKRLLMDWGHMLLLAIVGNGLIESMRRQSVFSMQSTVYFAYSMLYLILLVILSCASGMQQLAYWIGSATEQKMLKHLPGKEPGMETNVQATSEANAQENGHTSKPKVTFDEGQPKLHGDDASGLTEIKNTDDASEGNHAERSTSVHTRQASDSSSHQNDDSTSRQNDDSTSHQNGPPKLLSWCCFQTSASKTSRLRRKFTRRVRRYLSLDVFKMGDEYKWQPIATQAAIAFALSSFLTFAVDDTSEASNLFGILLGYLVQAGCLWTGIYTVLVFFQRAACVFRFFMKLRNHNYQRSHEGHFLEFQGPYRTHTMYPV